MKDITYDFIRKIDEDYSADKNNKIIENGIKNVGIDAFCIDSEILSKTPNVFNIELPKSRIYDQEKSLRCWIHAGINMIKNNVADNLNINESNYQLSVNYISFFDKLEKGNTIYNWVIESENFDLDVEIEKNYLKNSVIEGGYFEYFRSIVKKYGIVPECIMPDVKSSKASYRLMLIYKEKVKKDILKLLQYKKENKSIEELFVIKEKMLEENYNLLAKCLGEIPITFDYEYKNKNNECVKITNITPLEFAEKYLTIDLDDYVGIANMPLYRKEYNVFYRKNLTENVYNNSYIDFLNVPIEVLKELSIKQLRDGLPVCFSCDVKKMRDFETGIMDSNLFNFKDVFNIDFLTKQEALSMYDIETQHLMLFTGVHVENEQSIRWKVEDSYGDKVHKNGYYIMNDNYFDDFVLEVIIDKKYLTNEQLEMLNKEPVLYDTNEPM